jgi:hypothetical protein
MGEGRRKGSDLSVRFRGPFARPVSLFCYRDSENGKLVMAKAGRMGLTCLVVFLLPFCGVGVVTAFLAARSALTGDWGQAGFFTIFALTFGGVGFGMLGAAIAGRNRLEELAGRKAEHPREPWLWRPEWAAGRIECSTRRKMWGTWAFATFWNLVSVPASFMAVREVLRTGEYTPLLALIFPVVGLGLLTWALRETVRHRKYGVTVFELAHNPGVIGRGIGGLVRTSTPLTPGGGFEVTLTCLRRVTTGSGKHRSTSETIQWQEKVTAANFQRDVERHGTMIPVAFHLPPDVQGSDDSKPDDQIIWRLEARAEVPGVDYSASFDVPVFRTAESDEPLPPEKLEALEKSATEYEQPADSRIRVTRSESGAEVVFPPARNVGPAIGLTVFLAVWNGIVVLIGRFGAPIFFSMVFGFFGIILLVVVLNLWFGITRVLVDSREVRVTSGLVFATRTRTLSPPDIQDVKVVVGMQSGKTAYYRLLMVATGGVKVNAGTGIRDRREAEWLAKTMKDALGLGNSR